MTDEIKYDPLNDQNNIAGSQTQLEVVELSDEVFEIEINDEDIAYIIEDEDGNEVGFAVLDEDGKPIEYFYAEDDECCCYDEDCSCEDECCTHSAASGEAAGVENAHAQIAEAEEAAEAEINAGGAQSGKEAPAEGLALVTSDGKPAEKNELGYEPGATASVLGKLGSAAWRGAKAAGGAAVQAGAAAVDLGKEALEAGREGGIIAGASVVGNAAKDTAANAVESAPAAVKKVKENATAGKLEEITGVSKEDMQAAATEIGAVAKEGLETLKELADAFTGFKESIGIDEYADTLTTVKKTFKK